MNVPNQSWRSEIEAAESRWLSPTAIECCVVAYLAARLGAETDAILGEKALKTLRMNQEARAKLLDDFKRLPRSTEPVAREWEKWLMGAQPTLAITFDQEAAADNPKAAHLSVLHPLVRQAAGALRLDDPAYVSLAVETTEIPAGEYRFALYRWRKQGVKPDEAIVPVADDAALETALLSLLQSAVDAVNAELPSPAEFDALDARHHAKWTAAQAAHVAENRDIVKHRTESLKVSHLARQKALEDQLTRATNDKICLMKQSELARANAEFDRRMAELQCAIGSGDIHATTVLFGTITVTKEGT